MYCHRLSGAVECTLPNPLETGVQVWLMSSVGRLLSLFHANYKVKYNHCVVFFLCLPGALISLVVITLNSSGSDQRKNVDRGTDSFFIGRYEINIRGNTVDIYQIKHRG